ncbi:MAG: extracellular solute-binding protein [Chloroflexi bacterium]|nr:extracellular solute-binding protein [Chloroflexota bacterium]
MPTPTAVPITVRGTKVTLWHTQSGPNAQLLNKIVLDFNKSQSSYTIAPEYKGNYNDLYQANLAAINAGQPVTLSVAYENQVAAFYSSGLVVAWDEYMNNSQIGLSAADKADFFPAFLELGKFPQFGNKFLTFPFAKSLELMWYDADMVKQAGFDKPPATWGDFKTQMLKINKTVSPAWEFSADASRFATWVFSRGGDLISPDGKTLTIDTPEAEEAMALLAEAAKAKAVRAPQGYQSETDFEQQKTVFYQDSSAARSYILADLKKAGKTFNWTAEMPPVGKTGQTPRSDLYGGNVCLFKTSADAQRGAWAFMKYFSDTKQTAAWALGTGYVPLRKSATETPAYKQFLAENPRNSVAIDGLKYPGNTGEPKVAAWQQVRDILQSMLQSVMAGTAQPKQALAEANQKANNAMKTS